MRFDQPDPYEGSYNLADPQSLNRYSYVQNDPVNFVDPMGLNPVSPGTTFSSGILWTIWYGNNFDGWNIVHQFFEPYGGDQSNASQTFAKDLDFVRDFYKIYRNRFYGCMKEIFGDKVARAIGRQTLKNAPFVDMSRSRNQMPYGGWGSVSNEDLTRGRYGTVKIANDITNVPTPKGGPVSAYEMKIRTYAHELGNLLAGRLVGDIAGADAAYGLPGGMVGSITGQRDPDAGARFESCTIGRFVS
jgi:hypothetical protein